jgi:hypothetical protein
MTCVSPASNAGLRAMVDSNILKCGPGAGQGRAIVDCVCKRGDQGRGSAGARAGGAGRSECNDLFSPIILDMTGASESE